MAASPWMQKEEKGAWKPPCPPAYWPFSLSSVIPENVDETVSVCRDWGRQKASSVIARIFVYSAPKWSLIPMRGQKAVGKVASDESVLKEGPSHGLCLRVMDKQVEKEDKRGQRWPPLSRKNAGESSPRG